MAKYKQPDGSIFNGRIGGLVYKSNANGHYVQVYRKKNKNTFNNERVLQQFATLASHWRTLTDAEQKTWAFERIGNPKINADGTKRLLTPKQFFMSRCGILMYYCGFNIDNLPKIAPVSQLTLAVSLAMVQNASFISSRISFFFSFLNGSSFVPPNHILYVEATGIYPAGWPYTPLAEHIHVVSLFAGIDVPTYNFWSDYTANVAQVNLADTIYFRFRSVNCVTGQTTKTKLVKVFIGP